MKYQYDIIVIGLGPAGMAVSAMGSEMGLKVCAIENRAVGGECMNIGCIPSKALLQIAKQRKMFTMLEDFELAKVSMPEVLKPFEKIANDIKYINDKKTMGMFKKVDLIFREGMAEFVNKNTIKVGEKVVTGRKIFIATGTKPAIPPIEGIDKIEGILTNENIFNLEEVPESMTILGGGAIGSEMAQAFARLGTKITIVHMDAHLIPVGDSSAGLLLQEEFEKEGIEVLNGRLLKKAEQKDGKIHLWTDRDEELVSEKLLVAAGRKVDFSALKLENAGVKYSNKGIGVNKHLRTNRKNIYAVGDCNGNFLLTHAAMHQGMLALMNTMMPHGMKYNFRKFVVPWTVFTEPEVSRVGLQESQLDKMGKKYQIIEAKYEDYGAAIAENLGIGSVKILVSKWGRVYGATIVGAGSGEMIGEWALVIQRKINLFRVMFLQHSFPTMSFLSKRVSEMWMMEKMKSNFLKRMIRFMFRF